MSDSIRIDTRLGDTLAFGAEKPEKFYRGLIDFDITVNDERMVLIDFLGMGNMAGVLEAVYTGGDNEGKSVALKVLSPELSGRPAFVERFRNEALAMMELPSHPNIVDCFFHGTDERTQLHFMGLEFVPGHSLDEVEKPLPVREAFDIIKQIALGLITAHDKKKIHRDIKPGNILVLPDGTAKIGDFGLVRGIGDVRHTAVGTALGTPLYMAPEQIRGRANFGSDIYSVGATFYEILTGVPPYSGQDAEEVFLKIEDLNTLPDLVRAHNADVSIELEQIIMRTLAKDFRHRHLTVGEFLKDLQSLEEQSIDKSVKKSWKTSYGRDESKRNAFRLLELSQTYGLIREPSVSGLRGVIEECRFFQREQITKNLEKIDLDEAEYDLQIRYVENLERLLHITPQSPETVLSRIGWIEAMQGVWERIVTEDPSLNQALTQTQYMLGWEESQRERFGVVKPEPPKTFWERSGRPIVASVIVILVLGLLGSLAFIIGTYHTKQAETRRSRENYARMYYRTKKGIATGEFAMADENIKELRSIAAKLGDPLRVMELDDLEETLEKEKLEKASSDILKKARARLRRALNLVRATREEGLDGDSRNARAEEAAALHKEASLLFPELLPTHAESLRVELDAVVSLIGPQLYAFQTFDGARSKTAEVVGKFESLKQAWQKNGALSTALVTLKRRELEGSRERLIGVQRDFLDDRGKPIPRFGKLKNEIDSLLLELKKFERDIARDQFDEAHQELARVEGMVNILIQGQHYLDEDAEERDEQIKALFKSVSVITANVRESEFLWKDSVKKAETRLEAVKANYAETAAKIDQLVRVREGAKRGDVESTLTLARRLFQSAEYEQAQKLFKKSLLDSDSDAKKAMCKKAKASLHLSVIRLEARSQTEEGKVWVRGQLTSAEVDDLEKRILGMGRKENSQTPHHQLLDVISRLREIGRVSSLKGLVTDTLKKTESLQRVSLAIIALEKESLEKPDNKDLKKRLQLQYSQYLGAVTGADGRGFAPLREAVDGARKFVKAGRREVNPVILLSLGAHYADLGMNNDAKVQYQRFLNMDIANKALKDEVKAELEALGKEGKSE